MPWGAGGNFQNGGGNIVFLEIIPQIRWIMIECSCSGVFWATYPSISHGK